MHLLIFLYSNTFINVDRTELFNHVINISIYITDFIKDKEEEDDIKKNFNSLLKKITKSFTISGNSFITISKGINNIINNIGDKAIILFLKNCKDKDHYIYTTLVKKYNIDIKNINKDIKELDKLIISNIKLFLGGIKTWKNTIKKTGG